MFSNRIRSVGLKRCIVHFLIHILRLSFHVPQAGVSSANGQQFGFAVSVLHWNRNTLIKRPADWTFKAGVTALYCACGRAGTTDACRQANEALNR